MFIILSLSLLKGNEPPSAPTLGEVEETLMIRYSSEYMRCQQRLFVARKKDLKFEKVERINY